MKPSSTSITRHSQNTLLSSYSEQVVVRVYDYHRHTWRAHENSYCQVLSQCFRMLVWGRALRNPITNKCPGDADDAGLDHSLRDTALDDYPTTYFFLPRLLTRFSIFMLHDFIYTHTLSRDFWSSWHWCVLWIWGGPLGAVLLQWVNC